MGFLSLLAISGIVSVGPTVDCSYGCFAGVFIGEIEHFNQKDKLYGFRRYGFGYGSMQIGNGIGVDLISSSGMFLTEEAQSIQVGVDIGGRFDFNTNNSVDSFYHWLPGITVGPSYTLFGYKGFSGFKAGVEIGNYHIPSLIPSFNTYYGAGTYLYSQSSMIGAQYTRSLGGLEAASFSFTYGSLNKISVYGIIQNNNIQGTIAIQTGL